MYLKPGNSISQTVQMRIQYECTVLHTYNTSNSTSKLYQRTILSKESLSTLINLYLRQMLRSNSSMFCQISTIFAPIRILSSKKLKTNKKISLQSHFQRGSSSPQVVHDAGFQIIFYPKYQDRKSTRLNSSHLRASRMPSSA